ncbi:MAG: mannose-1-phosphate guanylyltransferase [Bacteroidales bacterium]|nr:mannose-1-phosphate guanylyltransferase [Bacteroidales bacterium]MDY2917174.1 mannose-1-phosphate guanylyltransferase [Muribaculaceae bacterium]
MEPNKATQDPNRYCVIMCGGIGSRFWPYSRTQRPKQFIDFFGTGRSLLQMTYDRILPYVPAENIIAVTNKSYVSLVAEQLPELRPENILAEPARRNTAPCIAWASHHIRALNPDASMIVVPSDHLITREAEFGSAILEGFEFVEHNDALLTLGIRPTRPETGYGYIQVGEPACGNILKVKTFTEKPNREMARLFLSTGEFFWNSGIFLWTVRSILRAFEENAPEIASVFSAPDLLGEKGVERAFSACPAISIDYAVMEKAPNVYVETVSFGWNDLGTWSALYDNSPKNRDANVTQNCSVLAYNSTGNIFAVSGDKLVVVDSLKDFIIADAGDVLLVCPKDHEQDIKQMVNDARVKFGEKFL